MEGGAAYPFGLMSTEVGRRSGDDDDKVAVEVKVLYINVVEVDELHLVVKADEEYFWRIGLGVFDRGSRRFSVATTGFLYALGTTIPQKIKNDGKVSSTGRRRRGGRRPLNKGTV